MLIGDIMKKIILSGLILMSIIFISGCTIQNKQPYSLEQIDRSQEVSLPIDSFDEAIKYSITLNEVKSIIENSSSVPENYRQFDWKITATVSNVWYDVRLSPEERVNHTVRYVSFWKGESCNNYQYQFGILENGTLLDYSSGVATCK